MRYVSTRGESPALGFEDVLLAGPAADGGLFVPETWPRLEAGELRGWRGLAYGDLAARVMAPFVAGAIAEDEFAQIVGDTYAGFRDTEVAPMRELAPDLYLLELFHGPTLAFKDYALQLVGRLFDRVLKKRGRHVTVIGATSGDTGSAAIEACKDKDSIDIFILHPKGRVSEVQRLQMTTVGSANVHNIAITGTFDDCQDLVKAMFADAGFRERMNLAAVNSINWTRVMAQCAYYFYAALKLGAPEREISFAVPTGNFGNIYAGYVAKRMGLPVKALIAASNRNDILTRFFETGRLEAAPVVATLSPAMDIQVSSNLERLLFELFERDGKAVAAFLNKFRETGKAELPEKPYKRALETFSGFRLDDEGTIREIAAVHEETGILIDPHTAVGTAAAKAKREPGVPMVAIATAHPAKFPEAVLRATGEMPELPPHLADLKQRPERFETLPAELAAVKEFISGRMAQRGAA